MTAEGVLVRRRREQQERLSLARQFCNGLQHREVKAVVVFGSVARGDFNLWSDVDVLVVDDAITGGPLERAQQLGDAPAGVQAVGWTAAEWCAERARGNPIAVEAQRHGIWLRGSAESLGC